MQKHYKRVLTIAGSDSGGGAGIQADVKTISACGCYAMTAITAITVQNTTGVRDVHPVPIEIIRGQVAAVLDDIGADAAKIGMLHSAEVIESIKDTLGRYDIKNIVLDPVMVATSGDKLLLDDAIETLHSGLIPLARVITPNIPEAEILLGKKIGLDADMSKIARDLSLKGKVSVLLKGGHMTGDKLTDVFYNADEDVVMVLKSTRVQTKNVHGTGCTLSSAIASFLALGLSLNDSVKQAKKYIDHAISKGADYKTGEGHGPVHHFFKYWK